uniref:Uncharacterized protein n=1 Tax=Vibrio tasmaniensis TaxID=212663 RepID=A0A0H3ZVF3_9VIBR|nr:hypothetical protein [Vibrio tasmaniensis]
MFVYSIYYLIAALLNEDIVNVVKMMRGMSKPAKSHSTK